MKILKIIKKVLIEYLPKKYHKKSLLICFANFIGDFLELIGIGFIPIIIYNLFQPEELRNILEDKNIYFLDPILQSEHSIIWIFSILIAFFIFKNFFLLAIFFFQKKLIISIYNSQKKEIFARYLNCKYEDYLQKNPSQLIGLINVGVPETTSLVEQILIIIREIFLIFIVIVSIFLIDPVSTVITFFCFIFFIVIFYSLTNQLSSWRGKLSYILSIKNLKVIDETFNLIKEIRLYNKRHFFFNLFADQIEVAEKQKLYNSVLSVTPRYIIEIGLLLIIFLILFFFNFILGDLNKSLPVITFISVAAIRLIPAFRMIASSINHINFRSAHLSSVLLELKNLQKENYHNKENHDDEKNFNFKNQIKISNVKFKYKEHKNDSLNIKNIEIKKGEKIGIIGQSGSGKTTFINVLLGFLDPYSGEILVDGKNIHKNIFNWSKIIGYVPQEINFLDDKISKNIALGIDENKIDKDKLENAINVSNLKEFVKNKKDGLDTIIGNNALKVSGGQRQRIGIARALYGEPQILILDEATNSLDRENEIDIINEIISIKNLTSIIIAHRVESLKKCDKIIVFEKGEITNQGKFDEVIRSEK